MPCDRDEYSGPGWRRMCAAAAADRHAAAALAAELADDPVWAAECGRTAPMLAAPPWRWPAPLIDAYTGAEPAEALTGPQRRLLVALLHRDGLTDRAIAERTRMSLYTTARIRGDLLGLAPNPARRASRAVA